MNAKIVLKQSFAILALALPIAAGAQAFPTKTVILMVPNPPGGAIDIQGRIYAQKLQEIWNQPVVVEYKPGAGTMIGYDYIAKSAPDGHTIGMSVTTLQIFPALRDKMPYDTLKDLAPVMMTGVSSITIAASPNLPANNLAELIALAKKQPGKLSYASPGSGSAMHLAMELLKQEAGIDILHVPFKGGQQAYPELMAGRIDLQLDPTFGIYRHIKAGKMKGIAVTSDKRDASAPEIQTVGETIKGFAVYSVNGLIVQGNTPKALINRINADFKKVLAAPDILKRLEEFGIQPVGNSAEEYGAYLRTEIERWTKVARAANIKMD